jgi:hypothetical protein
MSESSLHKWSPSSPTLDYIKGDHPTVESAKTAIHALIKARGKMAEYNTSILIQAQFTPAQCKELHSTFPEYPTVYQESGNLVMLQ